MKQDPIKLTESKYKQLAKRYYEVEDKIRNAPWTKVAEPYQDGWWLKLVLTEHADRKDSNGQYKAKALEMCQRRLFVTRDKAKVSAIRKKPRYEDVRPLFMVKGWNDKITYAGPHLSRIHRNEWEKMSGDLPVRMLKYFDKITDPNRYRPEFPIVYYKCIVPENEIMVKVVKRVVTEEQNINPALIKERDELKKILEPYWRTYGGHGGSRGYESHKRKILNDALVKVSKGQIKDILEDNKVKRHKVKKHL